MGYEDDMAFKAMNNITKGVNIQEEAIMDTLNTMIKPGRVSRTTGKTIGRPSVDYEGQLDYLKNNYSLEELPKVLIDNPQVLELIQGKQVSGAKMRNSEYQTIKGADIQNILNRPKGKGQSRITQDFLERFNKGKMNEFLHDKLGFGRVKSGGRVSREQEPMVGETYVPSIGYFDPKEWGTHKK